MPEKHNKPSRRKSNDCQLRDLAKMCLDALTVEKIAEMSADKLAKTALDALKAAKGLANEEDDNEIDETMLTVEQLQKRRSYKEAQKVKGKATGSFV